MVYTISLQQAQAEYPEFTFVSALTPSVQKAAFHVRDRDGNDLCLKLIAPDYDIDRLAREIQALQSIKHQNVARLKEYVFVSTNNQQRHHIAEEFVAGTDLSDSLKAGLGWNRADAANFFSPLCDGLDELRKINVVHRDLKPSNIRRRQDGSPVIIDFGLARLLDLPDLTNTKDGARIGTPIYFAPEQFHGTKYDIDHRTDLFALGILLYQALIGRHPFYSGRETMDELADATSNSDKHFADPLFRALPIEWQTLVCKLLEKERARRPRAAGQVASILRNIAAK